MIIKTERLVIKPLSEDDEKSMYDILTDKEIIKYYMVNDFKEYNDFLNLFNHLLEYSKDEMKYELGIYKDNYLIGFMNAVDINDDFIEFGYVISSKEQKKGYATEAFNALINELFTRGVKEVRAGAFIDNQKSFNVMKKCNMKLIENLIDTYMYRGEEKKCMYYSIKAKK